MAPGQGLGEMGDRGMVGERYDRAPGRRMSFGEMSPHERKYHVSEMVYLGEGNAGEILNFFPTENRIYNLRMF